MESNRIELENPQVEYLADSSVDEAVDAQIRKLLTTCFTKPEDVVFRDRRYFIEPYPHRWVIWDMQGSLVAHIGVHEKTVEADARHFRIGGICEVCVHPDFRGRGFVRKMLVCVHDWLVRNEFDFAILFGDPRIYGSSGYVQKDNLIHDDATATGKSGTSQSPVMVRPLTETSWPGGPVYLPGPKF
ncbi:MAG: GNAT family N-acetyltransferase [Sedimentisphaerales bacterium]|nr:GNAT family N-acetyltransferase [Sedimentisphaerales bacterium]